METCFSGRIVETKMTVQKMKSLVKSLQLLKLFTSEKAVWRIEDMARELGYHKSSIQRIVDTLEAENFLVRTIPEKRIYRLGPQILFLGNAAEFNLDIKSVARPIMAQLVDRVHETAYLCIVDQYQCLYIEKVECSQPIRMMHSLGRRNPMHCTGVGKALFIGMTNKEIDRVITERGLKRYTQSTITTRDQLLQEIECARKEGVAYDNEELDMGVKCIAAPIFDRAGRVAASISISGPVHRFIPEVIPHMAAEVKKAAREISTALGSSN
jgi:IclR family transcriptional regulator, KDG regulon repressor